MNGINFLHSGHELSARDIQLFAYRPTLFTDGIIAIATHVGNHSHEDIGFGDGSNHQFGAGMALLAADTTGHGHTILMVDGGMVAQ